VIYEPVVRKYLFGYNIYWRLQTFIGMTEQYEGAYQFYISLCPDDEESVLLFRWAREQNALRGERMGEMQSEPISLTATKYYGSGEDFK